MSPVLDEERAFERALRDSIMQKIEERELTSEDVAQETGMLASSVEALFASQAWPLSTALRVAHGLGLEMRPRLGTR